MGFWLGCDGVDYGYNFLWWKSQGKNKWKFILTRLLEKAYVA